MLSGGFPKDRRTAKAQQHSSQRETTIKRRRRDRLVGHMNGAAAKHSGTPSAGTVLQSRNISGMFSHQRQVFRNVTSAHLRHIPNIYILILINLKTVHHLSGFYKIQLYIDSFDI